MKSTFSTICLIAAFVCFVVKLMIGPDAKIDLTAAGLAFFMLSFIFA